MSNATADLVQQLIRNECVNDGSVESGNETRNVAVLETLFNGHNLEVGRFGDQPDRTSLVVRMRGREPDAPVLLLQGHTDVVPATAQDWEHDPFGGEIINGVVHGRGAVDMFNITASMAIAMANLSREGFVPRGDVIFAAVADEEAGGNLGAGYLVQNHGDLV
ncbi:MAG TPA: M20/M25/M40 family metallo-hydrolase, partial [Acidimicrobiia bacterium]|nr:M20/M25/M40 family metallo-hydrolase [Acidimicrobiia bacterium]